MSAKIKITFTKSAIGYSQKQKDTVRGLGFTKLNQSVMQEDNPVIRGMVHQVRHLVSVEAVSETE